METERALKEVNGLLDHFGVFSKAQDREAAVILIHRTVDEIVKYHLFYKFPIAGERVFRETARMKIRKNLTRIRVIWIEGNLFLCIILASKGKNIRSMLLQILVWCFLSLTSYYSAPDA